MCCTNGIAFFQSFRGANVQDHDFVDEKKFIVFETCLVKLFSHCNRCLAPCEIQMATSGSLLTITSICPDQHIMEWHSQPCVHDRAVGNLLLCGSVLFSGSNPTKILRLLTSIGIVCPSRSHYFSSQKCFLFPAVETVCTSIVKVPLGSGFLHIEE